MLQLYRVVALFLLVNSMSIPSSCASVAGFGKHKMSFKEKKIHAIHFKIQKYLAHRLNPDLHRTDIPPLTFALTMLLVLLAICLLAYLSYCLTLLILGHPNILLSLGFLIGFLFLYVAIEDHFFNKRFDKIINKTKLNAQNV